MTTNADIAKLVAELREPFDHSDIAAAMEKALLMQQAALALERSGPSEDAVQVANKVLEGSSITTLPEEIVLASEILRLSAERAEPVAVVINNNQRGGEHIVECKPSITLDVGTKLYAAPPAPADYPGLHSNAALGQKCKSLIALKTHFTGEPLYVGNEGFLLALREALDELKQLKKAPPADAAMRKDAERWRRAREDSWILDDYDESAVDAALAARAHK